MVNEAALLALLDRFGFTRCFLEALCLAEQIALFAAADAVLGPHGAGFANMLFMPEGALAMELFAPGYINPVMLPAVDALRLRYYPVPARVEDQRRGYPHGEHILAPLDLIDITLRRELGAGR